ncbi:unnamed protein product [Parnassius mnemosyne]|uniref:Uncharacterized protein n=1 Tax=Parnassius mnemosyne TaxID=213953 RepID=A0AAV1K7W3_9NEOP
MADSSNEVIYKELDYTKRNTSLISDVQDRKIPVPHGNALESQVPASSSYIMMDRSQLSGDVDRWIHGESATPVSTGVQRSRIPLVQRSTLTAATTVRTSGLCYALALMMPILRARHYPVWRCSPSAMTNTLEPFFVHLGQICSRIREQFRRLSTEHIVQELFSTAMDIILVVYAIGFLIISMCQSSINET